jgi:hypothetical protein
MVCEFERACACWYTRKRLFDGLRLRKRCAMRVWWGAVAQLGERLVRNEEVSGSIPLSSTKERIHCGICKSSQNRYCVAVLFLIVNPQNFAFYTASANGHFVRASRSACRYLRFWTAGGRGTLASLWKSRL